jgi:Transglycosylase SLT domain
MTDYSYAQLEDLWIQAGGPKDKAALMAAIAEAESSGNSQAKNPSGASGLWQILGDPFPGDPFNAQTNAKMAVAKYHEQGLGAWETYTSGAYKEYLKGGVSPGGVKPAGAQTTASTGGGGLWEWSQWAGPFAMPLDFMVGKASSVADVGSAVAGIGKDLSTFMHYVSWLFVPSHWIRIICFVLGVPLVGIGVVVMVKGTQPVPVSVGPVSTQVSGGSIAPAVGIAEVTAGSVLLFIAFHNLPDSVDSFPALLSYMQSKITTGVKSKEGPGPQAVAD